MNKRVIIEREELQHRYVNQGQTLVVIAEQIGCSASTVSNMLRRYGIPTRRGYFPRRDVPREILEQLYSIERLPIKQIIIRLGVSAGTIGNRRKTYGIPERLRPGA
jgi:DNA-binding Lrp family transcriptional regulator